jgi:hypothetical protein
MDFIQVAKDFPAWDVVDFDGTNIGVATNFSGEGFVVTVEADFTFGAPRTLEEPNVESLDAFRSIVASWLLNLKAESGGEA